MAGETLVKLLTVMHAEGGIFVGMKRTKPHTGSARFLYQTDVPPYHLFNAHRFLYGFGTV